MRILQIKSVIKACLKLTNRTLAVLLSLITVCSLLTIDLTVAYAEEEPQGAESVLPTMAELQSTISQPSKLTSLENNIEVIYEGEKIIDIDGKDCIDGEVIVKFKSHLPELRITNSLQSVQSDLKEELSAGNLVVTDVPEGETVENFIDRMEEMPEVEYAQPNYVYHIAQSKNDPYANSNYQWYLDTIGAYDAWDITMGIADVKVAVLDTGIDNSHPEFLSQIYKQWDYVNNDSDAQDDHGHGTHVSGIIAAKSDNGVGISGIAPEVELIAVKVLGSDGYGTTANIVKGINYSVNNGADVINMSFGGYSADEAKEEAINNAVAQDVVCVVSAGNDETSQYATPSDYEACISVMATDKFDERADYSNYGSAKDICAPGSEILSTVPGSGYANADGTSMASPVVAAVAALVLSVNPDLTVDQVKDILYSTAIDLGDLGKDSYYGHGRVCALAAIYKARGIDFFSNGSGTELDPYQITTQEELNMVRYCPDSSFIVMNDIDLTAATADGGKYWYQGLGWLPIQNYNGTFDGDGHSVIGLSIYRNTLESGQNIGLFSCVGESGIVTNLNINDCFINGYYLVGAVSGKSYGEINDCHFQGEIIGTDTVGGIVGVNYGNILNCSTAGIVRMMGYGKDVLYCSIGGIAGRSGGDIISNCTNRANVIGDDGAAGIICLSSDKKVFACSNYGNISCYDGWCGGIVGHTHKDVSIDNCYNSGDITLTGSNGGVAGGIAAWCGENINNCFNSGWVEVASSDHMGGIAGGVRGTINFCYSIGNKGIVGNGESNVNSSFYLYDGTTYANGTAKTTEELRQQETFSGFDFDTIWSIDDDRFPVLQAVPFQYINGFTLDKDTLFIGTGRSRAFEVSFDPSDASNKNITWSSSNESVATVVDGTVNALGLGTTVITATSQDGGFTATCNVTVEQAVTSVTVSSHSETVLEGDSLTVTATVKPDDAAHPEVTWSSSNVNVATVNQSGFITAVGPGSAAITALADGVSDICQVIVNTEEVIDGKLQRTYYNADGNIEKVVEYCGADDSSVIKKIHYYTGGVRSSYKLFDESGNLNNLVELYSDGKTKKVNYYDISTGRRDTYKMYDTEGRITHFITCYSDGVKPKKTNYYNAESGVRTQYKLYDTNGRTTHLIYCHSGGVKPEKTSYYDVDTGKRESYKLYDAQGRMTHYATCYSDGVRANKMNYYDVKTGKRTAYKTYRTGGTCICHIVCDSNGNASVATYYDRTGKVVRVVHY